MEEGERLNRQAIRMVVKSANLATLVLVGRHGPFEVGRGS